MPRYEFRCHSCDDTFEVDRPMARSGDPASCPSGHDDTVRLLSAVSVGGTAAGGPTGEPPVRGGGGGGCCGGGCCG
ncbi:zinc ribbon domain-containing protein [Streptomyces sp. NPDC047315]|uniref:FmdB family zinc ribbon protein n=1 Tax=Streptomyces sp. NPDC047315 TaxID=3155142 RepID=UPI00340395A9